MNLQPDISFPQLKNKITFTTHCVKTYNVSMIDGRSNISFCIHATDTPRWSSEKYITIWISRSIKKQLFMDNKLHVRLNFRESKNTIDYGNFKTINFPGFAVC